LNDLISRAFGAAGIPVGKKPAGLVQKDGKRPDGCTLIPWEKNQQVWFRKMESALTAALLSLGVVADLWLGTSQCAPQWLLRT